MTGKPATYELQLERTLAAAPQRVWKALTDAQQISLWYGPSDEYRIEVHAWDCRVGGKYRVSMHHKGGNVHSVAGEFREISDGKRLSYTWAWEGAPPMNTLVTFEIKPEGKGTRLHFLHTGLPDENSRNQHNQGWTGSMDRLAKAVK